MIQKPIQHQSNISQSSPSIPQVTISNQAPPIHSTPTKQVNQLPIQTPIKSEQVKIEDDIDINWLYVCDWRGCQR